MILNSVVDRYRTEELMYILMTDSDTGFYQIGGHACSLYCTHQNAYGLPAKHSHMFNMAAFLGGALDILIRTLKRALLRNLG